MPAAQANDDQVGMLLLRADFEYARAGALAESRWDQVADLDQGIAELEAMIRLPSP